MKCDFESLVLYLERRLDVDGQLGVLAHLEECDTCFETMYQLCRDRDADLYKRSAERLAAV